MILVSQIISRVISALDAEGSDRYRFEQDLKPAINASVEFLTSVFNKAFSDNKLTEENLRDLVYTKIWQTSKFSKIYFNPTDTGGVWSLIRVSPEPIVDPLTSSITNADDSQSIFASDLLFVKSKYSANRLTYEEESEAEDNIFVDGNALFKNQFKSYSYTNFNNTNGNAEIEILPFYPNGLVAVTYLKRPTNVSSETDSVEFPESMTTLLVRQVLNSLSTKQGDGTNLYAITEKDVSELVSVMS